jgi:polysaccharide export outer membrane protein
MDFPMRGACAAISCLLAALALSGCMRTTSPVASMQPRSDLDVMAYGQAYAGSSYVMAPAMPVQFDAAYQLDAGGSITMPLIGAVPARGRTPAGLAAEIGGRLRNGYIRDPSVAVEIDSYRPFFILGEVAAPGQYPYVPNMSVESAVAIAGGFTPRARRDRVTMTHTDGSGSSRVVVPLGTALGPGDTVLVGERWF